MRRFFKCHRRDLVAWSTVESEHVLFSRPALDLPQGCTFYTIRRNKSLVIDSHLLGVPRGSQGHCIAAEAVHLPVKNNFMVGFKRWTLLLSRLP